MATYKQLERRINGAENTAVIARWEFGGKLLAERQENGGKQLPDGRLSAVAEEVGKSEREVQYRIQLAEICKTADEVRNALRTFGSWHSIIRDLITTHRPEPEPHAVTESATVATTRDTEPGESTGSSAGEASGQPSAGPATSEVPDQYVMVQDMLNNILRDVHSVGTAVSLLPEIPNGWHGRYGRLIARIEDELRKIDSQLMTSVS